MAKRRLDIDWRAHYQDRLISMEEAAKKVEPGDGFWMGQATQLPYRFLDEMHLHMEDYDLHDISLLWNCANMPFTMAFDPEAKKRFEMSSIFMLPLERASGGMGVMDYAGSGYDFTVPWAFENGANAMAIHICPPDENGYCNLGAYGVSNGWRIAEDDRIRKIFAFIDHSQVPIPGAYHDVALHVSQFTWIIEDDQEFVAIPAAPPTPVDKKIASFILPRIKQGDKVEIGFGGLGEEILSNLRDIGQLEVFAEVACDNMATLTEEGVLTKVVAGSPGACSQKFFDYLQMTDKIQIIPDNNVVSAFKIAQLENIVAINATFMIDLIGQACSEAQGLLPYSGAGGSFAFIYGAINASGGRSFLCLRSTHKGKDGALKSNIVPWLPEGSIVTTPKNYQMYVVTEWGLADLWLKPLKTRIQELIKIAHPSFRKELKEKILTTPLIREGDFAPDFDSCLEAEE